MKKLHAAFAPVIVAATVSCGGNTIAPAGGTGGSSNRDGGSWDSGGGSSYAPAIQSIDTGKKLGDLTVAEGQMVCEELNAYLEKAFTDPDYLKRVACAEHGGSGGLGAARVPQLPCEKTARGLANCQATVAELNTCFEGLTAGLRNAAACDHDGGGDTGASPSEIASCVAFEKQCPAVGMGKDPPNRSSIDAGELPHPGPGAF